MFWEDQEFPVSTARQGTGYNETEGCSCLSHQVAPGCRTLSAAHCTRVPVTLLPVVLQVTAREACKGGSMSTGKPHSVSLLLWTGQVASLTHSKVRPGALHTPAANPAGDAATYAAHSGLSYAADFQDWTWSWLSTGDQYAVALASCKV